MDPQTLITPTRRPRFRRAPEPPPFRLADDDVEIVRHLARHRFLRSTHIAALVGRSLDRTNDRLLRLFHAGYIDRPRAQLDLYPVGSAPMVYALADRGARLLIERDGIEFTNVEWSRKNRKAGRPFIEHQLEIMDFYVSLQCAARACADVPLIHPAELVAAFPDQRVAARNPFTALKNMDVDALLSLRADVERLLVEKGRDLQRQIALLDGSGRVAGGKKRGRPAKEAGRASLLKGTTVPPKYRGPEGETWAGRGATPRWLKALLDEGHSIEEFAIARKGRKAAAATAKTPKKRKPAGNRGRKEKVAAGAA